MAIKKPTKITRDIPATVYEAFAGRVWSIGEWANESQETKNAIMATRLIQRYGGRFVEAHRNLRIEQIAQAMGKTKGEVTGNPWLIVDFARANPGRVARWNKIDHPSYSKALALLTGGIY